MPLRDHFHPPLSIQRHWHAFHNAWAANLAAALNQILPPDYFAESNVQFGIQVDVATLEELDRSVAANGSRDSRAVVWSPPAPVQTIPLLLEEEAVEVKVFSVEAGPTLVGAVELVSPANKDRAEHREAFLAKCESYLRQGLGLVMVDVVTSRHANLHNELITRLHGSGSDQIENPLYATAYRPVEQDGASQLEIWLQRLSLGAELPTLPLWLRNGPCVPIPLEPTYHRTCAEQRIC